MGTISQFEKILSGRSYLIVMGSLLCCAVLWGIYLRFFQLAVAPYWLDESFSFASIAMPATTESWNWLRAILYHSVLNLVTDQFGVGTLQSRVPSVLVSSLGVFAVAALCYRRFGLLAALLAVCIMSFGYWHIAWARQAREYACLMAVFWVSAFLFDSLLKNRELKLGTYLIAAFVMTALATAIHPFGLLVALLACLAIPFNPDNRFKVLPRWGWLILIVVVIAIVVASTVFGSEFNLIYAQFLAAQYWLYALLALPAVLIRDNRNSAYFLIWITSVSVIGFLVISLLIPLTNLRYVYFLTPLLAIFVAASVRGVASTWKLAYTVFALIVLWQSGALIVQPKQNYTLETFRSDSGFTFYTPQPRFDLAYAYINNRLGERDLVTPYPTISRLYRDRDDTLVIDAKVTYKAPASEQSVAREYYTQIPFATGNALFQLAEATGEIYILLDTMALERIELSLKVILLEQAELVRQWRRPPHSTLYLYKLESS